MSIDIYMTATINGMIALPNGDVTWSDELWKAYFRLARTYDAIIVGHTTYKIMAKEGELEKLGNPLVFILSKSRRHAVGNTKIISSPASARKALSEIKGGRALVCGGAKTVAVFLQGRMIDRLIVDIEPQLFSKGINLVSADAKLRMNFKLQSMRTIKKKIVRLTYKPVV